MTRKEILAAAEKCVCGDREQDYGIPENSFRLIAEFWHTYLSAKCVAAGVHVQLEPEDVAAMMAFAQDCPGICKPRSTLIAGLMAGVYGMRRRSQYERGESMMNKTDLEKILTEHTLWLHNEEGKRADLSEADLRSRPQRSRPDFSVLPLWCGSLGAKVDERIISRLYTIPLDWLKIQK